MRLCAHVRHYLVSANTIEETGIGEHISRLTGMLKQIAYTYKRKHKCSVLPHEILPISIIGQCCKAFLAYTFALESKCKDTKIFPYGKKYFTTAGDNSPAFDILTKRKEPQRGSISITPDKRSAVWGQRHIHSLSRLEETLPNSKVASLRDTRLRCGFHPTRKGSSPSRVGLLKLSLFEAPTD